MQQDIIRIASYRATYRNVYPDSLYLVRDDQSFAVQCELSHVRGSGECLALSKMQCLPCELGKVPRNVQNLLHYFGLVHLTTTQCQLFLVMLLSYIGLG